MAESQRLHKPRSRTAALKAGERESSAPAHTPAAPAGTAWAAVAPLAPFSLGGIQRKVAIGASNDPYEREADSVAGRVVGGQRIAPGTISSISPAALNPVGQRQSKPEETKKDDKSAAPVQRADSKADEKKENKPAATPVQREVRPEDKTKDAKAAMPVQRAGNPHEKKDQKAASPPVQRAEKKANDKREKTPPTIHRRAKDGEKKDDKPKSAPVQRATESKDKKNEDMTPAAVQRETKSNGTKDNDKTKPASAQRKVRHEDRKKIERDTSAPVQKQEKPAEKKKENAKSATPVMQRADNPPEKRKDEKPPSAVQRETTPEPKTDKPKNEDKSGAVPVQRETKPEDGKKEETAKPAAVQRAEKESEPPAENTQRVQTSSTGSNFAASAASMESAASHAIANKGAGEPLQSSTRNSLESGFGSDLSDVRVHSDTAAHSAAEALNARAFTHQSDIWLGRGESQHNLPLMAHEATHVLQQTGSVHRQIVQRADKPSASATPSATIAAPQVPLKSAAGEIDVTASKMTLPKLEIPAFKAAFLASPTNVTIQKGGEARPSGAQSQRNIWKNEESKTAETQLKKKPGVRQAPPANGESKVADDPADDPNKILFLKIGTSDNYFIGTPTELKTEFTIPRWGPDGKPRLLDVDHQLELQLGGLNKTSNMWLLDASANRSSGSRISQNINDSIAAAVHPFVGKPPFEKAPETSLLRQQYTITYASVVGSTKLDPPANDQHWSKDDIEKVDKPLEKLKALNAKEIQAKGLLGKSTNLVLYPLSSGGKQKHIAWNPHNTGEVDFDSERFGFMGLSAAKIKYEPGKSDNYVKGTFVPTRPKKVIKPRTVRLPLIELGGIPYTVVMQRSGVLQAMRFAEFYAFSPVEFDELSFAEGRGFVMHGKLMPDVPIFQKLDIDVEMDGVDIWLSKTFTANDFKFPGPIKVPEAALTVSAGTGGLKAQGVVLLEVEKLGKGKVTAEIGTKGGLELTGSFDFDTQLFDPANVHAEYKEGKFSAGGTIGIKPGKVRGIKSATLTASIDDGVINAKGSIKPDIPAVEQADLSMHYSQEGGLIIAGDLQLKKDVPGIESGSVHAEVVKKPEQDRYLVKAHGEATPKIPGISSKLIVTYDDGAFDASVTAGYEKGMLKGTVTLGATNRPVGEDGQPGPPPKDTATKIIIYGGGSVSLRLAPWLQATAAIKFKPNGEVGVTGEIGLPSTLDLFDEKKVEKNIFKIGIDIPILGFSVLGQHVGIFLNVGGGLDLSAGIGPGQLRDVALSVTYNPAHEEDTTVHGHAALHIPAHAGLRLSVHAALGAGIPIVDAEAGIELGGTLGIEGAAHADVDVDWSPKKGLVLDASASISAEPKFKFDITGYVLVEADLLLKTITLYEKRWQLAAFEYGSGLRLGLKMPIHYEEGKAFSVSLSDIQFEVPNIDPMDTLKGLIDRIV